MIIYQSTKEGFLDDVFKRDIQDIVLRAFTEATGGTVAQNQVRSWASSLVYMGKVLNDPTIPTDAGVAIEYTIPSTRKRVDFLVTGKSLDGNTCVVIVELKQWDEATATTKDGVVTTRLGGAKAETSHPSYQAWSYAALLRGFNEAVYSAKMELRPCAYLHNYPEHGQPLNDPFYAEHMERAPLFLRGDEERARLRAFIATHVRAGDKGEALYAIEHGRVRPSKALADALAGMLKGNEEFVLIDDQKVVFETAMASARRGRSGKRVYIVEGGPGTGKSVLAINLLVANTTEGRTCKYVTKNSAPREVYAARLTGSLKKTEFSHLFSSSGSFHQVEANTFDVLVVDEAHRLNERSGLFGNLGENQVKELINATRCAIFFIDEDQRVTLKDIGQREEIRRWARELGAKVEEGRLESQFRCNGSDGYLAWLDDVLGIRPTANPILEEGDYDVRVVDSPAELRRIVLERNEERNRARMVAGYCWDWASKKDASRFDIVLPDFQARWNLTKDGMLWIMSPASVAEVGCVYTCQGLELDHVGVIIGDDLVFRDGQVVTQPERHSAQDAGLRSWRALVKAQGAEGRAEVDAIIRNTYRTLLTRGARSCTIYCTDPALAAHLKSRLDAHKDRVEAPAAE